MNDILAFLNSHVSVRQFTGEPISEADETMILTTAQRSATSSNLQAYSIISVRNQAKKERFAQLTGNQAHVAQCSLFLVFCADLYRLSLLNAKREYPFYGEFTEALLVATVDTALVADRALEAAQAMGFGGVMVGSIRNYPLEVSDLLELPELVYPVVGMSLGKPASVGKVKPRLPLTGVNFKETYRPEQILPAVEEYDRMIDEVGHLKGREVSPEKYPDFEGNYSWSEHSARRMASDAPTTLRPDMMEFLQKRGFMLR
jgi:FMN reductase (NADPH)